MHTTTIPNRAGRDSATVITIVIIAALHVAAAALIWAGHLMGGLGLGIALFAYTRGLLHALDADHLCMIDSSTRKLLGEGRNPRGVGLAFSLGHSTVVLAAGAALIGGASWVRTAIDPDSTLGAALGGIGATVSATYLLAVAAANVPLLIGAIRGRRSEHSHPTGWWARLLAAPLSRVRHAGHVYLFGLLFGLGFDTASTIAVLMVAAAASLSGASTVALFGLPLAFTAAMTLGDSINANVMLRVYRTANTTARRRLNIALLSLSIGSAVVVATATVMELVGEWTSLPAPSISVDWVAWVLIGCAVLGGLWLALRRPAVSVQQPPAA